MTARFPAVIDNTLIREWRRCRRHAFHKRFEGLQPALADGSIDLAFGKAFAYGIEQGRRAYYEQGGTPEDAVAAAQEAAQAHFASCGVSTPARSAKTPSALSMAVSCYFNKWQLGEDGYIAGDGDVEYTFKVPLSFAHPDTGEPLVYAGRCDLRATSQEGGIVFIDEKTTARFTDSWLASWDMDTQVTGYIWAERLLHGHGHNVRAEIRGVAVSSAGATGMVVPCFRTEHQVRVWEEAMRADVEAMLAAYLGGSFEAMLGDACVRYGRPCEYVKLCNSPNAESLKKSEYRVEFWNPLKAED